MTCGGAVGKLGAARRRLGAGRLRWYGGTGSRWGRQAPRRRDSGASTMRERGCCAGTLTRFCGASTVTQRPNGRRSRMPDAGEGATVLMGSYDVRGVHWAQAAGHGAAVRPSRQTCSNTVSTCSIRTRERNGRRGPLSGPEAVASGLGGARRWSRVTLGSAGASGTARVASHGRRHAHLAPYAHRKKNACNGRPNGRLGS